MEEKRRTQQELQIKMDLMRVHSQQNALKCLSKEKKTHYGLKDENILRKNLQEQLV